MNLSNYVIFDCYTVELEGEPYVFHDSFSEAFSCSEDRLLDLFLSIEGELKKIDQHHNFEFCKFAQFSDIHAYLIENPDVRLMACVPI